MRKAHLKDGIAVTKFMYWLKHTIGTCDMTEMTAAHKIEELRAEQGNYIEPSFVTIAAYKENAAMCHYHPSDEVCKKLKPEGLLLVDSGGQYLEGTTDITRTYALGPLTEKEKRVLHNRSSRYAEGINHEVPSRLPGNQLRLHHP